MIPTMSLESTASSRCIFMRTPCTAWVMRWGVRWWGSRCRSSQLTGLETWHQREETSSSRVTPQHSESRWRQRWRDNSVNNIINNNSSRGELEKLLECGREETVWTRVSTASWSRWAAQHCSVTTPVLSVASSGLSHHNNNNNLIRT